MKLLKIGELAEKSGVTVRTLHHYDKIELLRPKSLSESGHRLYSGSDIERLQQILSLKSLGLSLTQITSVLKGKDTDLEEVLKIQSKSLEIKIRGLKKVEKLVQLILKKYSTEKKVETKYLLKFIREVSDMENIYTPEQLKKLQARLEQYPNQVKEVETAWPILFKKFEDAMQEGLSAEDPEVQKLAQQAQKFIEMFTGGDKEIEKNLDKAHEHNKTNAYNTWGVKKEVFEFADKARKIYLKK